MQSYEPLTLVVTVDPESGPRRNSTRAQLKALAWPFTFVDGLTTQSPEVAAIYDARQNRRKSKRPLAPAEVAAYASHRKAMGEFLATDHKVTLILEDDFHLVDPGRFASRIKALMKAPVVWDILKLFDFQERPVVESIPVGDIKIVSHGSPTAGMVGYLITRRGAQRMLRRPTVFRQIDEDIKFFWELKLRVLSVQPNLIVDIGHELGGSLIEPERLEVRKQRSWVISLKGLAHTGLRKLNYRRHRKDYCLTLKKAGRSS